MKIFSLAAVAILTSGAAYAQSVQLATAGIWTTSGDITSPSKVCAIQGKVDLSSTQMIGKLLLPKEDHGHLLHHCKK